MRQYVIGKLKIYLLEIDRRIQIEFPTVSGLSPYIKNQTFKYVSISYSSKYMFTVNTTGKVLDGKDAKEYAKELLEAASIIITLNSLVEGLEDNLVIG